MSKFTEINTLEEFTNNGITYGIYWVKFNDKKILL